MKITIKSTVMAKLYYPQLIGKTFENCEEIANNFIKIPCKKNEGGQYKIAKANCIILDNKNILDEVKNINNYLSKIILDENIISPGYASEYFNEIIESLDKIKQKYNDMLRSHE